MTVLAHLPPFAGPRLKLVRADRHINELEAILSAFGARVAFKMVECGRDEEMILWRPEFSEPIPTTVPLCIGDAVHNLRSALDIMICDIARLRNKSAEKLKYPFADSAEGLTKIISKLRLGRLGPDVIALIEATAPHQKGNGALRGLHDLDILDKHQLVLPTVFVRGMHFKTPHLVSGPPLSGVRLDQFGSPVIHIHAGGTLRSREGIEPLEEFKSLEGGAIVAFPEGLPFERTAVLPVLKHLAGLTQGVVERFASTL